MGDMPHTSQVDQWSILVNIKYLQGLLLQLWKTTYQHSNSPKTNQIFGPLFNKICHHLVAAIAQWIHRHLPFCRPGFEPQAPDIGFVNLQSNLCYCEKNEKEAMLGPIKTNKYVTKTLQKYSNIVTLAEVERSTSSVGTYQPTYYASFLPFTVARLVGDLHVVGWGESP